jgi:hypothetical protein
MQFDPVNDRIDVFSAGLGQMAEVTGQTLVMRSLAQLGLNTLKCNVAAADPTAANDSSQGYSVGSNWTNSITGHIWVATSVALGAATWFDNGASSIGSTADGNTIFGQTAGVVPPNSIGLNNDYFADMDSGKVWGPKAAGAWPPLPVFNIQAAYPGVTPPRMVAWGTVSAGGALLSGSGCTISHPSAGLYQINFTNALADPNFVLLTNVIAAAGQGFTANETAGTRSTTGVSYDVVWPGSGPYDAQTSFTVLHI